MILSHYTRILLQNVFLATSISSVALAEDFNIPGGDLKTYAFGVLGPVRYLRGGAQRCN